MAQKRGVGIGGVMRPGNTLPVMGPVSDNPVPNTRAAFLRASGQRPVGGAGFNPYAAGNKMYGAAPNMGPMRDKTPFQERDRNALTMRNAMLRRLKARNNGRFMSSENLSGEG